MSTPKVILVTVGTIDWNPTEAELQDVSNRFAEVRNAGYIVVVLRDGIRMTIADPDAHVSSDVITTEEQAKAVLDSLLPLPDQNLGCACGEDNCRGDNSFEDEDGADRDFGPAGFDDDADFDADVEVVDVVGGAALDAIIEDIRDDFNDNSVLQPGETVHVHISTSFERDGVHVQSWSSNIVVSAPTPTQGLDKPPVSM